MSELLLLGPEILEVLLVGLDLEGHALDDLQAVALDAGSLARVVGDDAHLAHPQVVEDLRPHPVVAEVRREAQALVGLDGVEALRILETVGADLVLEADPAPLLAHVEDHALPGLVDHLHGAVELLAAVAAERAEGVAREAFAVDADEDLVLFADLALHERDVVDEVDLVLVHDGAEIAPGASRQRRLPGGLDELLLAEPVLDQVGDGDDPHLVLARERHQVRHASHGAVVVHDLADHAGRAQAGQSRQIDRALGLARAAQHAALAGTQRNTWPGRAMSCGRASSAIAVRMVCARSWPRCPW